MTKIGMLRGKSQVMSLGALHNDIKPIESSLVTGMRVTAITSH